MTKLTDAPSQSLLHSAPCSARQVRTLNSEELMRGADQIEIIHRQEIYRLRVTRQGKLILTK